MKSGGSSSSSLSISPPPTPPAVALLFGSRARPRRVRRKGEGKGERQVEEAKAGDGPVAWVRSGEGDEEDDSISEIESLDEVRLSESSPLGVGCA
jgi:hypothetical protein